LDDRKDHELADEDVREDDELGADDDKYDAGAALRAAHQLLASEYAPHQAAGRHLLAAQERRASPNAILGSPMARSAQSQARSALS